jgi:hypothetical protein
VSTRSVDELVKATGMTGIFESQVSRLCSEIDDKIGAFVDPSLEGDRSYLWLDARGLGLSSRSTPPNLPRRMPKPLVANGARPTDQIRPKVAKPAALMDAAETDVLALMSLSQDHRPKKTGHTRRRARPDRRSHATR